MKFILVVAIAVSVFSSSSFAAKNEVKKLSRSVVRWFNYSESLCPDLDPVLDQRQIIPKEMMIFRDDSFEHFQSEWSDFFRKNPVNPDDVRALVLINVELNVTHAVALAQAISRLPRLIDLELIDCDLTDEFIDKMHELVLNGGPSQLIGLNIFGAHQVSPHGFSLLPEIFPNLTHLNAAHTHIDKEILGSLIKKSPSLRSVYLGNNIYGYKMLTPAEMGEVRKEFSKELEKE